MYDWSELTPQKAAQIRNAICGAIGWISAGRNEGNNAVAGETVNNLAEAAAYFETKCSPEEPSE